MNSADSKISHSIIVVDFEFVRGWRNKTVIISGAMSDHDAQAEIMKIQGKPLVIYEGLQKIKTFNVRKSYQFIKHLTKIFKKNPTKLQSALQEFHESLYFEGPSTLTKERITDHINSRRIGNELPYVVFWNGINDEYILTQLKITDRVILDMTAYDQLNNNEFHLKLINRMTGRLIFSQSIGTHEKNGRMLSLSDTHDLVCPIQHNITYFHDPVIDVMLAKCIFNYIVDSIGIDDILFEEPEEIW